MRRVLIILIVVFSITTISAQKIDVEEAGFKGKVKSVTQVNYHYVDNSKGEEYERRVIKYDSEGSTIEEVDLNHKYIVEWMFEYYD